jgi:hypothetical protein
MGRVLSMSEHRKKLLKNNFVSFSGGEWRDKWEDSYNDFKDPDFKRKINTIAHHFSEVWEVSFEQARKSIKFSKVDELYRVIKKHQKEDSERNTAIAMAAISE